MEVVTNGLCRVPLEDGFNPQRLQQGVLLDGVTGMEKGAEAAGVTKSQCHSTAEDQINMVMPLHGGLLRNHPEGPAHPQVDNDRPPSGLQQQILCPAPDLLDNCALYLSPDISGDWPAQGALANNNPGDGLADGGGFDSSACGLDFRQFRHGEQFNRWIFSRIMVR